MKLFAPGTAVKIRYPTGQANALTLAQELAARLDELVVAVRLQHHRAQRCDAVHPG